MKAWLAYGDCHLADAGQYNCQVLMRLALFEADPGLHAVVGPRLSRCH